MTSIGYLLFYVLGIIPTYVLPYFGSNSYLGQAVAGALSQSTMALTWTILHAGALVLCIAVAWARGKSNGRPWLMALPIVAAVFDLAPFLNMVPLVPTILHVIALVVGFMPAATPIAEDSEPDARFILLLLAGIVGGSIFAAGANAAYATAKIAHQVKVAKEEEIKRQEDARIAAESARVARERAEAQKAAELAEAQAKQKAERDTAAAKFTEIETTERAAYDARERLLAPFSNVEIQARLTKFASELNKGNSAGAAAALMVDPMSVYAAAQDTVNMGGLVAVHLKSFNSQPGVFKFQLKTQGYDSSAIPTGYDLKKENTAIEVSTYFTGKQLTDARRRTDPIWAALTSCLGFKYRIYIDNQTGAPKGELTGYTLTTNCNRNS